MAQRDDFFTTLKGMFHPNRYLVLSDVILALLTQNQTKLDTFNQIVNDCEDKIYHWLGTYDSKTTDEDRTGVLNSVCQDFVVDPNMVLLANPDNTPIF